MKLFLLAFVEESFYRLLEKKILDSTLGFSLTGSKAATPLNKGKKDPDGGYTQETIIAKLCFG